MTATTVATDVVERVADVLRRRNIETLVVDTADEARAAVLAMIPQGAEVYTGKSKTLEDTKLFAELVESGRYRLSADTNGGARSS